MKSSLAPPKHRHPPVNSFGPRAAGVGGGIQGVPNFAPPSKPAAPHVQTRCKGALGGAATFSTSGTPRKPEQPSSTPYAPLEKCISAAERGCREYFSLAGPPKKLPVPPPASPKVRGRWGESGKKLAVTLLQPPAARGPKLFRGCCRNVFSLPRPPPNPMHTYFRGVPRILFR